MKKIVCMFVLSLLVLIGCGKKGFEIEQLEEDIKSQTRATSFDFLDELKPVELEDDYIKYMNKIQFDNSKIRTIQDVEIKYKYDKKEKKWKQDFYKKKLDHYEALVDAIQMQSNLRNKLGFEDEILIGEEYIKLDDINLTLNQIECKFDGNKYSDYIYEIVYDNGAVQAKASYKITFIFLDSRGEWDLVKNEQIEDFVLTTSIKEDKENQLEELVRQYLITKQQGIIDLIGDDSNMTYALSIQDENITFQSKSTIILEGLKHSYIDIQFLKNEGPVYVDVTLRVFLKLDEYNRAWEVVDMQPLVNQTSIRLSDAFIGEWEGYFNIRKHKHKAILQIDRIISDGARFEGIMSFGSSDTYAVEDSSYCVLGGFVKDDLLIECSKWIVKGKNVNAYTIYIDELKFTKENLRLTGNMTWEKTDDYKAEFIKM